MEGVDRKRSIHISDATSSPKVEVKSFAHYLDRDCSEQNDAEEEELELEEDLELERCLCEEMDKMDSSISTWITSEEIQGTEGGDPGELTDCDATGEAGTLSEWLNFMRSAQGITRYIETVTTQIQQVSKSLAFSMREEHKPLKTDRIGEAETLDGEESERANSAPAPSSGSFKPREVLQGGMDERTRDDFPVTVPSTPSECLECVVPSAGAPAEDCNAPAAHGEVNPAQQGTSVQASSPVIHVPAVANTAISERNYIKNAPISNGKLDSKVSVQISTTLSEGLDKGRYLEASDDQITAVVKEEQVIENLPRLFLPSDERGPASVVQGSPRGCPPSAEQTVLLVNSGCESEQDVVKTTERKVSPTASSFRGNSRCSRELEWSLEQQLCGNPRSSECWEYDTDSAVDIMAYVEENEVSRRIGRATEQILERQQRDREERLQRIKCERSAVVLQATWRGRCARTNIAPSRAARQRELIEMIFMFEEERATARFLVIEARHKEIEWCHQSEELNKMRHEDQRTRHAWGYFLETEEMGKQEELARMRAEERGTRAFIDLDREETRRLTRIRRETEETLTMMFEDAAMRELIRTEETEVAGCRAMGLEDASSKKREIADLIQQATSKAEISLMVNEDDLSLTWNIRYRSEQEASRHIAQAKSTPIQRAMDPIGMGIARRLVTKALPCSGDRTAGIRHIQESQTFARPDNLESSRLLVLDHIRRRELYRSHLDSILRKSQVHQSGQDSGTLTKPFRGKVNNGKQANDLMGRHSHSSPFNLRSSPAGKDGTDCALTADMLSHLGPLQSITGMELCVEGLTSVSLLRVCTSLKSLSLNVNRLSSPADLAMCTALVRLGLRDNRLSSLEGLAGLSNLRELRLDINHLTSLHELKSLPSLVELSANTNHIKELPERFSAGLMSSLPQSRIVPTADTVIKSCPPSAIKSSPALCALQKLELYHNKIAVVHPRALDEFGSLTYLDLGRNQLKSLDGRAIENCPALSTLILSQNCLRKPPFPMRLPLLTELWLSGNQISTMGEWATDLPKDGLSSRSEPRLDPMPRLEKRNKLRENCELMRRLSTSMKATEGFVWLPSLMVLHLEDNAVDSLGGRWSLAGCPSLRFLDVSFNRLRTMDDITPCLKACGELREVRLHDNPVSETGLCSDMVLLNCAKLERVDGVPLDRQARWKAGVKTYSGRSDLVFPFLMQASQAAISPLGGENSVPSLQKNGSSAVNIDQVAPLVKCPWCGSALSGAESVKNVSSQSQGVDICPSSSSANPEKVGERKRCPPAGSSRSPRGRKAAGQFDETQKNTCATCGFVPPDTSLWSVPNVTDVDLPFKWEDILSAGHRWRCDPGGMNSIVNDSEEFERDKTFQEACHQGCEERVEMMRRHRREQRDLVSSESVFGGTPRAENAKGGVEVRSTSAAPSTRKLELELKLWERHARERRDIADRLLRRLHSSVGIRHANTCKGQKEHCVLMDLQQSVAEGVACTTDGLRQSAANAERAFHSVDQRNHAASIIQYIWRRRQERTKRSPTFPTQRNLVPGGTGPVSERAVTALQSAFRGFHVRRMLQAALDSARYVDDELEGLLDGNGGDRFELDHFLSPPPELAENWMNHAPTTENSFKKNMAGRDGAAENIAVVCTVNRHTPRRSENAANSHSDAFSEGKQSSSNRGDKATRAGELGTGGAQVSCSYFIGEEARDSVDQNIKDGLNSACSHPDRDVTKGKEIGASIPAGEVSVEGVNHNDSNSGRKDGITGDESGNELIRSWGLKDPCVATMMLKRMKRLRRFHTREARRVKMKDPDARFEAFVKKAGGHRRAHAGCEVNGHITTACKIIEYTPPTPSRKGHVVNGHTTKVPHSINACHSDQAVGSDAYCPGASDASLGNGTPGASPQRTTHLANLCAPSTTDLRPHDDTVEHIPSDHLSPDEGKRYSGRYPLPIPTPYATRPWPPSSQPVLRVKRGDTTGAAAGGRYRPRATLRAIDLCAQVSSGGLRTEMGRREEEGRQRLGSLTFGASGHRTGEQQEPP